MTKVPPAAYSKVQQEEPFMSGAEFNVYIFATFFNTHQHKC